MKQHSLIKSGLTAAVVALSGFAQPAAAEQNFIPQLRAQVNTQIPQLGPQGLLPGVGAPGIQYPTCPTDFTLTQRGAHIFICRKQATGFGVPPAMNVANATSCSPWAGAPEVYQGDYAGSNHVTFKCRN